MILYIDTTDYNRAIFWLYDGKTAKSGIYNFAPQEGYKILSKLEEFLKSEGKRHKAKKNKIIKIVINKGPGSFVGTRVGASLAQALSLAWAIPVKYLNKTEFERTLPK